VTEPVLNASTASVLLGRSPAEVTVRLMKRENHVWRIRAGGEAYFLKALGWPYLITRQLDGRPMIDLLPALRRQGANAVLAAVGRHSPVCTR
jgi:hypothetical protein